MDGYLKFDAYPIFEVLTTHPPPNPPTCGPSHGGVCTPEETDRVMVAM